MYYIVGCLIILFIWLLVTTIVFSRYKHSHSVISYWADYNDTSTTDSPVDLVSEVWTNLPNNGEGSFTNTSFMMDAGVTTLMDKSTGAFDFRELSLGDTVYIRNDYEVTPTLNGTHLSVRYLLGTGEGQYTLEKAITTLSDGARSYRISLGVDMIYMGDDNTRQNPVQLQVLTSEKATVKNNGSVVHVLRHASR